MRNSLKIQFSRTSIRARVRHVRSVGTKSDQKANKQTNSNNRSNDFYPKGSNGKVNYIKEQMNNINREIEILRKNQKETLEIKNTIRQMKNAFDDSISRLDMAEEEISELEDMINETPKIEKQREKKTENKTRMEYAKTVRQLQNM